MKRIYLVRHGESEANAGGFIAAGDVVKLSPKGIEQAKFVAKRATKLPIEVVIASTMLRAQQTAQYIAEATGKKLEVSNFFHETIMPSEQYGKTEKDEENKKLEAFIHAKLLEHDFRHSDEENLSDLKKRATQGLAYLIEREESEILVVTHGLFLRVLVGAAIFGETYTGKEAYKLVYGLSTTNTGITVLEHDAEAKVNQWRMRTWNDHAHLAD